MPEAIAAGASPLQAERPGVILLVMLNSGLLSQYSVMGMPLTYSITKYGLPA